MVRRRFRSAEEGASAVEFALVAPMFIALMFATIELGVMELMASSLDTAVLRAARKIRTGASDRPTSATEFANQICSVMADSPANCQARLATSVQKVSSFAAAQTASSATPSGQFNAGGPGDVILVKVTYTWPLILPMYAGVLKSPGPNQALLDARVAFRNEPYG